MNIILSLVMGIMAAMPAYASAPVDTSYTILPNISLAGFMENKEVKGNPSTEAQDPEEIDTRAARIDAYYAKRNMPLEGYGEKFVEVADKYDLDWRLLPAIGVRESSGGKRLMNNNPFGWGSARIPFEDFNEAIEVVGWNLSGNNPNTAAYYSDPDNYTKLWYYNGTVMPSYPDEVLDIMDMFENTEIGETESEK